MRIPLVARAERGAAILRVRRVLAVSRHAVATFIWSRAAVWVGALFVLFEFSPNHGTYAGRLDVPSLTHDLGSVTDVWARWDSVPYLAIAEHGYGGVKGSPAFYPLYPWLVGGVGRALGDHFVVAGVLVSLAATLGVFLLFDRLARRHLPAADARRALIYLAVFPMSLFLQAVYAESLFLLLVLAAFLAAERGTWWLAGLCAGLALLTRPTGVALALPLLLLAWRSGRPVRAVLGLLVAPLMFLLYPFVLHEQIHDTTGFLHAEQFWHRKVSFLGPLDGIWRALHAAWAGLLQLTIGSPTRTYWTAVDPARTAVLNLEYFAYLVVLVVLTAVAWRRIGAAYGLFAAGSLAIPLSAPSDLYPLLSLPRLGLTMFPVFLALATFTRRTVVHTAVVSVSSMLLGMSVAGWATWQWVS